MPLATRKQPRAVDAAGPRSRLFLRIDSTLYGVERLACDPSVGRQAVRLVKADGTRYDLVATPHGPVCDCPDFVYRRDGLDPLGCKHVRALGGTGLLDGGRPTTDPKRSRRI